MQRLSLIILVDAGTFEDVKRATPRHVGQLWTSAARVVRIAFTGSGDSAWAAATPAQVDLAARGTAWGDAVRTVLANNLGGLSSQVANFLEDAAQGTAVYSASLASQPAHGPFQGSPYVPPVMFAADSVPLMGVAPQLEHASL
jgi:hypothetical protein